MPIDLESRLTTYRATLDDAIELDRRRRSRPASHRRPSHVALAASAAAVFAGGFGLAVLSRGDGRPAPSDTQTNVSTASADSETELLHLVPGDDSLRLIGLQEYDLPNGTPYTSITYERTTADSSRQVVRITTRRPLDSHFWALDLTSFRIAQSWSGCFPSRTVTVHEEWDGWMWLGDPGSYFRIEWNEVTSAQIVVETWGLSRSDSLDVARDLDYVPPTEWASVRSAVEPTAVVSDSADPSANWLLVEFRDPPEPANGALIEADDPETVAYLTGLIVGDARPTVSGPHTNPCGGEPVAP